MLFLVSVMQKETVPLPPEKALELAIASIEQIKKDPRPKAAYSFAGLPGGIAIVDVKSHVELDAIITSLPLSLTSNFQIYPLMTLDEALKNLKEGLKMLKESMK